MEYLNKIVYKQITEKFDIKTTTLSDTEDRKSEKMKRIIRCDGLKFYKKD